MPGAPLPYCPLQRVPPAHPSCARVATRHASVFTVPPIAALACSAAKDDDDLLPLRQGDRVLRGKLRKRDVERQRDSQSPLGSPAIDASNALHAHHLPRSPTHPAAFDLDALRANRPDVTPVASPIVSPTISRANSFQHLSDSDGPGAYERHSILEGTLCMHRRLALAPRERALLLHPFRCQAHDGRSKPHHHIQPGWVHRFYSLQRPELKPYILCDSRQVQMLLRGHLPSPRPRAHYPC